MAHYEKFRLSTLAAVVGIILTIGSGNSYAEAPIQFNTQFLDVKNGTSLDLNRFSRKGYIMPGKYTLRVMVNESQIAQESIINYYIDDNDPDNTYPCLTPELLPMLGLKPAIAEKLTWMKSVQCIQTGQLEGMDTQTDLSQSTLKIIIPQAYLEYSDDEWDPPSRWDEGIPGVLFDYNVNSQWRHSEHDGGDEYDVSGNGTLGANLGPWRLRADWQGNYRHENDNEESFGSGSEQSWDWNRYYAYRAIPQLQAQFTLGEGSLESDIFDGFNYLGGSLITDDQMLPPNLRGYAPDISGVARTNAKVTVTQRGRVIYESQVPAGPFRIQDINEAVSGELNVRVEEQDGGVQEFVVNTANIPYLTRPGSVRFKLTMGKPSDWQHHLRDPMFGTGELSWGISNGWSLYGGILRGGDYNALSLGIGRDLMFLGALSFDATHSRVRLPWEDLTLNGDSYRLSYSKNFDEYDSQVTFAGYRFSEQDFMTMSEYLDARSYGTRSNGNGKEMYTVNLNKHFRKLELSSYINFSRETYWDRPTTDRYNITLSHYFDLGRFRGVSISLSAYRNQYNGTEDNGAYVSMSIPWSDSSTVSYNAMVSHNDNTHRVGYYDRVDEHNNYQLSAGNSSRGVSVSGYYSHEGDMARMSANASYQDGRYSAIGLTMQGGLTLTSEGGAMHRSGMMGGTRMLIDTEGVPDVPVRGYGSTSRTNAWGKAVISDVNSYYRNKASIDLNQLGDNIEATVSVVQATLTEGAIGYRKFDVISGAKAMAAIKLADGSEPPFGATVINKRKQETGIVNDSGNVYLSGINAGETMVVHWGGSAQCEVRMPALLQPDMLMNTLRLLCKPLDGGIPGADDIKPAA